MWNNDAKPVQTSPLPPFLDSGWFGAPPGFQTRWYLLVVAPGRTRSGVNSQQEENPSEGDCETHDITNLELLPFL